MILIHVLALSAIALANINANDEYAVENEACLDILQQGESLINESPGCRLVKALFNNEDILAGAPEDVKDVCDASPTCVDQLTSLIAEGEDQGCKWNAIPGENGVIIDDSENIELIKKHASDVSIVTGFFCQDNCYAVTQAIEDGDMSAATCDCLLAFVEDVDKLTEDARHYLDLDAELDSEIASAISKMECIGNLHCFSDPDGDGVNTIWPVCSGKEEEEFCDGDGDCDDTDFCNCDVGQSFCSTGVNPCVSTASVGRVGLRGVTME